MDLEMSKPWMRKFVTNVGIVTSDGPWGPNAMACEWTHQMSYSPFLIALNIDGEDATAENIAATKEFGVNLVSESQNVLCSISGKFTGKETDKIALLKEFGAVFYKAKRIKAPMLKGASMNAECRLVKTEALGDHTVFVGEVTEISGEESASPILYHNGGYWRVGENVQKPPPEVLESIIRLGKKYSK